VNAAVALVPMLAGLPAAPSSQAPAKPLEFRTRVAAVFVDAFVTRGGRPLPDLQASNFELRDNGVPQRVELLSGESRPLCATMVFDTSSSVAGERLAALRAAAGALLDALRPADEAALVGFDEDVTWLAAPTPDRAAVRRAIDGLRPGGWTAVFDALYAALLLSAGARPQVVVLFTDGEDNASWLGGADLKLVAERSPATLHVVAWRPPPAPGRVPRLAESAQDRALREIAEASGGRYWRADSPSRLRQAFSAIADAMGHRYVLRYEPSNVTRTGWHRIDARLRGVRGELRVRRGYWVGPE
jgi:VWFA-related protein